MHPTVGDTLSLTAEKYPERTALVYPRKDQTWSYREFDENVNRLANALSERGVGKGDRVSTLLFNTSEMVLTMYAASKLGAAFNPLNFRLPAGEVTYILNDAESSVLVYEDAVADVVAAARDDLETVEEFVHVDDSSADTYFYDLLADQSTVAPSVDVSQDDDYIVMYTSGTTGRPKGVVHAHRDMIEHSMSVLVDQQLTRDDVGLSAAPLYHSAELHVFLIPRIHVGAATVIQHSFDPELALSMLAEHDVTVLFGAPTMWLAMLQADPESYDLSALRLGGYGGASMAPATVRDIHERIGCDLLQYYGMTELGPAVTVLYPDEQLEKAGSAGIPILNHDVRIARLDEDGNALAPDEEASPGTVGEIIVQGPALMRGYWKSPEKTDAAIRDGWYYSGDLGYADEDGYVWVKDRADNMIISGGENIYPREVEDTLLEHADVFEAAVVGVPDDEWGEKVVAYVAAESGTTAETLDSFLLRSDDLADFKRPREYAFVDELPKTPSGKIQKFELREEDV
ncbi:long-chain fatty acid--CoA ligase [Haladaptatus sp. R4]|uniref:long-chain-fatty-acid--CoA ligase n=1 Tax=Haladaptatus sp. R4 TaxID=1679489 RepID=UPI0007B4A928|nr:long-chain-fatty-acid--CoA ligase [Haladaptatus sp. R4]KZN22954.1 long-chain fatty acid--CoA ligase [Haladaptatus sp. R4]